MTIITHTLAMVTSPGFVDQDKLNKEKIKNKISEYPFCKKCENPRPFKSHHCSTCQGCILKMDHHCPWIANCVGFGNQKFFYQFLFYASLGDFLGAIGLFTKIYDPSFTDFLNRPNRKINLNNNLFLEILRVLKDPLMIILGFGLCIAMAVAIGFLFLYQTYLISNDSSSIDQKKNQHKCAIEKLKTSASSLKNQEEISKDSENKNENCKTIQKNGKEQKIETTGTNIDNKIETCNKSCENIYKSIEKNTGFFMNIKNSFKKKNIKNMKVILGDTFYGWLIPAFQPNEYNNGYNYQNSDNE